jgi:hypothetical protein
MKNLVMGFATNQTEPSVRNFCSSLRRVYGPAECDIIIVTNKHEGYFGELARDGVQFFHTPNNYSGTTKKIAKGMNRVVLYGMRALLATGLLERVAPEIAAAYAVLIETWHHPQIMRWFSYERVLEINRHYGQVFLSDVKDVLFQAPLFPDEPADVVTLFDQDEVYGSSYWDTKWYRDGWGEAALAKVMGKRPICIGTILGPQALMLSLVREIVAFFGRHPFGCVEQAVFNHMLLTGQVKTPYRIADNVIGPVATLSNEEAYGKILVRDGYIRRAADLSVVPAVHMYDRFDDTRALYAG